MESQNKKNLLGSLTILGHLFPVTFIFQFTTHVGVARRKWAQCGFLPLFAGAGAATGVGPGPVRTAAPPVPPLPGGVYEKENNIKIIIIVEVVYTKNRHCITREDQKHEVFLVSCDPAKQCDSHSPRNFLAILA